MVFCICFRWFPAIYSKETECIVRNALILALVVSMDIASIDVVIVCGVNLSGKK